MIKYICLCVLYKVTKWFFEKASTYLLICEPSITHALSNNPHPSKTIPLTTIFPSFMAENSLPNPLPEDSEHLLAPIFRRCGFTSTDVYQLSHTAVDKLMISEEEFANEYRFYPLPFYRYVLTISVTWSEDSQAHHRNWWTVVGSAFLEGLIKQNHWMIVLRELVGHARPMLRTIMLPFMGATLVQVPGLVVKSKYMKRWSWYDMMILPKFLPSLEIVLAVDPEAELKIQKEWFLACEEGKKIVALVKTLEGVIVYIDKYIEDLHCDDENISKKGQSWWPHKVVVVGQLSQRKS